MSLLAELRRRNVIRMAGLYLVGAWLMTQVAATLLPVFGAPVWVMKALVVLLALGFFAAVVFAWVFELTPNGIKRDAEVPASESIAPQTARRLDRGIIVVLLVALGYFAFDKFVLSPGPDLATSSPIQSPQLPLPPSATPANVAPISAASIAVLPFVNMSTDTENGFFADGISEELLNVLARVDGLKVASRTSSFSFKGKDTPIPEIARQLGVQHVLEGSVRKQGQRVRITAQLIHAGSDGHLWSETYDRDLTDIFKVQEEIAQAITGELEGILGKRQIAVTASTNNLDAYQAFLRGRARFHRRDELLEAIKDLSNAAQLDENFAEAWIYLAATWMVAPGYYTRDEIPGEHAMQEQRTALQRATTLAPEHPMVLAVRGVESEIHRDLAGSLALLEQASKRSVQDSNPMMWRGILLLRAGYVAEAITVLEQAVAMDPLSGINHGYLALTYLSVGRYPQAEATARRAEALGWNPAIFVIAYDLAARGDRERALEIWDEFIGPADSPASAQRFAATRSLLRDPRDAAARAILREQPSGAAIEYLLVAFHGQDELFDIMEQLHDRSEMQRRDLFWMRMAWMPSMRALREDPRFYLFARNIGMVQLWETRGWPDGCRRDNEADGDHLDCSVAGR
ncbi:MAG: hypothetical protein EYC71_02925 [Gammaproteobacteria bacterium]|nr:MAG: hypothetical protein EYC71_02925 [Gammaproteobacteria bacterium]